MNKKETVQALIAAGYDKKPQAVLDTMKLEELNKEIVTFNKELTAKAEEARKEREIDFYSGEKKGFWGKVLKVKPSARITEVVASYSRKQNLGNYESQDFFCSMKAEVLEEANVSRVYKALQFSCQQNVLEQINNKSKPF